MKNFKFTSTNGKNNNLVFVKNGIVNLAADANPDGSLKGALTITGGESNVGIYTEAAGKALSNNAPITITNSNSSIGIFAKSSGTVTNSGEISATGKSIKSIVALGSTIKLIVQEKLQ